MADSKNVLITGVSKGLGRALALELARHNHTIIGCSRNQTKLDSLQAHLSKLSPNNHHMLFNVDVTSDSSVQNFAQLVAQNNLIPDIIVNNAALATRKGKIWEIEVEEVDNVIDTNVKGITNVLRHFIPLLIHHNKQGIIINMSSNAGREAFGEYAVYCSSKWAVEGLSKCVAKELPEGLAIVSLDPGTIYTDSLALCLGHHMASQSQSPQQWALKAAPIILGITTSDNGAALTIN